MAKKLTPALIDDLMSAALREAERALTLGEVPIGAVVASATGEIIARAHNEMETSNDPTAHAEILALRRAAEQRRNWRLNDHILCVTLEPCTMCCGALQLARIGTLIFGADDPRAGACGSLYDLTLSGELRPRVIRGVEVEECQKLLHDFFADRRKP